MELWAAAAGILGGIVLIGNAGAYVYKVMKPAINVKKTVEKHEQEIAEIKMHEKNDLEAIEELRAANRLQLRAMITLLNHMIDGNNVEDMKSTRDAIQDLLVNS